MNFDTPHYLATGTPRQQQAHQVLVGQGILQALQPFDPILTGTIPLNIDIPTSDLDIICCWQTPEAFTSCLTQHFATHKAFTLHNTIYHGHQTIIAKFIIAGFPIEVFGQPRPVKQQEAYRHMIVEHNLLIEHGDSLRHEVIRLKNTGLKTEPAFTQALNLPGDPYQTLLTRYPNPIN